MVRAARCLFVFLLLLTSLSISQATAFAQDERNETDFGDSPGTDDSRSDDVESDDQSSEADLFTEIVSETRETDPAYGPDSGELEFDQDGFAFANLNVEFQDFLLEVAFELPDLPPGEVFEYGIVVRISGDIGDPGLIQFGHDSQGSWVMFSGLASEFADGSFEMLDIGVIEGFDDSTGAENVIVLLAQGPTIQVGLGDELIATIEVPYEESGLIMLNAVNYLDDPEDADPAQYNDLTIWDL